MKIYTRTGDKGITSLLNKKKISKAHPLIEACGSMDELVCYTGLLREHITAPEITGQLTEIQKDLMKLLSYLAGNKKGNILKDILLRTKQLEENIDKMNLVLSPQKHFIIPGGSLPIAHCHIARTLCRKAERRVVKAMKVNKTNAPLFSYLNRLSDYLYTLSRYIAHYQSVDEIFITSL